MSWMPLMSGQMPSSLKGRKLADMVLCEEQ